MTPSEFLQAYVSSGRTHGVEHTLSLIDDQAVYWFSNGDCHIGKAAIEAAIRHNQEAIQDDAIL